MRKALSIFLCMAMLLSFCTVAGYAIDSDSKILLTADTEIVKGGKYCINTVQELEALAKIVNEKKNQCEDVTFYLGNDIVVNDGVFSMSDDGEVLYNNKPIEQAENLVALESIGTGKSFKGFFDGKGFTVSGLYLNGLFNKCSSARISNLKIVNSYVTSSGILGSGFTMSCRISKCYVEGIVCSASREVGLVAGSFNGAGIRDCNAKGYVKGDANVGGFAGRMRNCEAEEVLCDVQITANSTAGGFAGMISGDNTVLERCVAIGSVDCKDGKAGQFASSVNAYVYDDVKALNICYAAVKSEDRPLKFCSELTGDADGVNQCYYMSEKQGEDNFKTFTEAQMKSKDFVDVLNDELIKQCEKDNIYWGYYGVYFVGNDGEFPIPYGLHHSGIGMPSHCFGDWMLYSPTGESRACSYYACDETERRTHYHTWGEYTYNNDAKKDVDGTKTAHCTKEGCTATDTVLDSEHLRLNAISLSETTAFEKGKLYTIGNFEEWKIFSELCKQDTTGITFALINDIKMSPYMKPIEKFSGTLDGMNHKLSRVFVNGIGDDFIGIFAQCDGAVIKNITVSSGNVFDDSANGEAMGMVCAKATDTKFTDCTVNSMVSGTSKDTGGLVGYAENCEIIGCRNLWMITGLGGYTGGLIGRATNCTISECYNSGKVYGDYDGVVAGGLVGKLDKCKVSYCYSIGEVYGDIYGGGFAGEIYPTKEDNTIKCCYAAGEVKGKNCGQFCGYYSIDNIFALSMCLFVGNDVSQADSNGAIDSAYKEYFASLRDDDIGYEIWTGKDLGIDAKSQKEIRKINNSYYEEYFVGEDSSNYGFMQLRRFHTEHVWGEYKLNANGQLVAECRCEGCRYTKTKEHIHEFRDYIVNEDKLTETAVCACGEKDTRPHTHVFGDYTYNNDADCEKNGTMTAVCTGKNCGVTDTVDDPNHKASGHNFGDYVLDGNGLTETAHCNNSGCEKTETIEHVHSWGEYVYNNDAECVKDGTMTAHCTKEGCKATDTVKDPNHKATGHSFGEWKSNGDAKFFKNGTESRACEHCGLTQTRVAERSAKIIVIFDKVVDFIFGLFK